MSRTGRPAKPSPFTINDGVLSIFVTRASGESHVVIADASDAGLLTKHRWHVRTGNTTLYAATNIGGKTVFMHRLLLCPSTLELVDHANHNGLDNRRSNIRIATALQNVGNLTPQSNTASGFKGVTWHPQQKKWWSRIGVNGRRVHIGLFADPILAAKAYDAVARDWFGVFAMLNFPDAEVA